MPISHRHRMRPSQRSRLHAGQPSLSLGEADGVVEALQSFSEMCEVYAQPIAMLAAEVIRGRDTRDSLAARSRSIDLQL